MRGTNAFAMGTRSTATQRLLGNSRARSMILKVHLGIQYKKEHFQMRLTMSHYRIQDQGMPCV